MNLRDDIEQALRAWDAYEQSRKASPVIDYDCAPRTTDVTPMPGRLDTHTELSSLHDRAKQEGDRSAAERLCAHLAYLGALLGERPPLDAYVAATQGCPAAGWPQDYVTAVGDPARTALADLGIPWGADTDTELRQAEGPVDVADAPEMWACGRLRLCRR